MTFPKLVLILFGILGYLMKKYDYESAPLVLAFVLGPMFKNAFRQSLITSGGSSLIFISRPIAATFLLVSFILLLYPLVLGILGQQRRGLLAKE